MKIQTLLSHLALLALSGGFVNTHAAQDVPGSISYQGRVTTDGTNFSGAGQFKFALVGPGTVNLSRTATARANLVGGQVQSITVLDGGWGYVAAPMVMIQDLAPGQPGSGVGAAARTLVWTGGSTFNSYWNNSANWDGVGVPANGDSLTFPSGAARLTSAATIFRPSRPHIHLHLLPNFFLPVFRSVLSFCHNPPMRRNYD